MTNSRVNFYGIVYAISSIRRSSSWRKTMKRALIPLFLLLGIFPVSPAVNGTEEISQEELERWFNSNSMEPPRYKEVNDGHLVFLTNNHDKSLHHHHNTLTISRESLDNGWILLEQCHRNIDKVAAAQILFKAERVKNITITKSENINKAWVEDSSVQMEDIRDNAVLCLRANSHSLVKNADGSFSLHNGPFMRRFLDGYFPIRVSLDLNYADTNLILTSVTPQNQSGFKVVEHGGKVHVDTVFEGKLQTEFHFRTQKL